MSLVRNIYFFFSSYANEHERSVGQFFGTLTEHNNQAQTRARLKSLLQRDIAALNLWTEYAYKGYRYLKKSKRRELYANLDLIAADFERFRQAHPGSSLLAHHTIASVSQSKADPERLNIIQQLLDYFSPERGLYVYQASSSFGRLLQNPSKDTLVGDCNQIVTLYIYLYSRYFDVSDLQVRLFPGHVALHYGGIDIEATNGTVTNYQYTKEARLLPVQEIVSVNLLDTSDLYLTTHEVSPKEFLQAARFSHLLSHERHLTQHNLEAAYSSLITMLMKRERFMPALEYAKQSRDIHLRGVVGNNGAIYYMRHNDFKSARRFAEFAPKRSELVKESYISEGTYHYNAHRYQAAINAFKHAGSEPMIRRCYEALFFAEQSKLGTHLDTKTIARHSKTIHHMSQYAKKSANSQLIAQANNLKKYL
ncbi:MAG: hypothetical protein WAQ26_01460 [Candidatus Saccharimonas aalborgensis]